MANLSGFYIASFLCSTFASSFSANASLDAASATAFAASALALFALAVVADFIYLAAFMAASAFFLAASTIMACMLILFFSAFCLATLVLALTDAAFLLLVQPHSSSSEEPLDLVISLAFSLPSFASYFSTVLIAL